MAITKIWKVRSRLDTSLDYITNPEKTSMVPDTEAMEGTIRYIKNREKTEDCLYVRAYNCSTDYAFSDMLDTQDEVGKRGRKNGIIAYHIVQSFKDFETTPEIAHACGCALVEKLFSEKYEAVLATHVDHKHLHNHIIINAVSYVDGKKYRNSFKDYFIDIRGISDEICREHCLSVIYKPKGKGMHYAEWKAQKEGRPTIRGQIRAELDEVIKVSYTNKDFWQELERRGYVVHRHGENVRYPSVIPPFGKRPVRLDNLGEGYTVADIYRKIRLARNGIKKFSDTPDIPKAPEGKKLKGFQALYYHYLYLFGKIQRKETPQRVSFFLRDEIIKLERYQRQFHFLVDNHIETETDLLALQKAKEQEIGSLIEKRIGLYAGRTPENADEVKTEAQAINKELGELRKDVRLCKAILEDAHRIAEKKRQADTLQEEAEREWMDNEHKRRGR